MIVHDDDTYVLSVRATVIDPCFTPNHRTEPARSLQHH